MSATDLDLDQVKAHLKNLNDQELASLEREAQKQRKRKESLSPSNPKITELGDHVRKVSNELKVRRRDVLIAVAGHLKVSLKSEPNTSTSGRKGTSS